MESQILEVVPVNFTKIHIMIRAALLFTSTPFKTNNFIKYLNCLHELLFGWGDSGHIFKYVSHLVLRWSCCQLTFLHKVNPLKFVVTVTTFHWQNFNNHSTMYKSAKTLNEESWENEQELGIGTMVPSRVAMKILLRFC